MEEQEKFAEDNLLCPISGEIMENPVVASDGHTYEKKEILQWMTKNKTSPLTREPLTDALFPNLALKNLIGEYHKKLKEEKEKKSKVEIPINKPPIKVEKKSKEDVPLNKPPIKVEKKIFEMTDSNLLKKEILLGPQAFQGMSKIEDEKKLIKNVPIKKPSIQEEIKKNDVPNFNLINHDMDISPEDLKVIINIKENDEKLNNNIKGKGISLIEEEKNLDLSNTIQLDNQNIKEQPFEEIFIQAVDFVFTGQPTKAISLLRVNDNYMNNIKIKMLLFLLFNGGLGYHKIDPIQAKNIHPTLDDIAILEELSTQGNDFCQYFLGRLMELNIHNTKDEKKILKLFTKSAEKFNTFSITCLGNYYETKNDMIEACKWYEKASRLGYSLAQFKFAKTHEKKKDLVQAFHWYRESGRNGFCFGLFEMAKMILEGKGTLKNEAEALKLFLRISNQEFPPVYAYLGYCYHQGIGTPKDLNNALNWYSMAANCGDKEALEKVNMINDFLNKSSIPITKSSPQKSLGDNKKKKKDDACGGCLIF